MQTNPSSDLTLRRERAERRRGTAIIEFAFAWTTFFFIAVVGIMDFGPRHLGL